MRNTRLTTTARRNRHDRTLDAVTDLYTLGPEGTNCAMAAREWFARRRQAGRVHLYPTLEDAVDDMPPRKGAALMACIAYPELHTLMFSALGRLRLTDCLILPTFDMVYAGRTVAPRSAVTHPAPRGLLPPGLERVELSTSNAQAAADCRAGRADACITTRPAARLNGLTVFRDYGPIDMGFSVHTFHPTAAAGPSGRGGFPDED
jgi:hypothetical protein